MLALPSLGTKHVGIGSVNVLAAMHGIGRVPDTLSGVHEHRGLAIWTAAERQHGVMDGLTGVDRDGRVEAKDYGGG